jgi:hypothetical protein
MGASRDRSCGFPHGASNSHRGFSRDQIFPTYPARNIPASSQSFLFFMLLIYKSHTAFKESDVAVGEIHDLTNKTEPLQLLVDKVCANILRFLARS